MRTPQQLVHSRARIRQRYAMFPLEGYPVSRSPLWTNTEIRVLTSPAMGAGFLQHHLTLAPAAIGKRSNDPNIESFLYVLSGQITLRTTKEHRLLACDFAFVPPKSEFEITTTEPATILLLHKTYEPAPGIEPPKEIIGSESKIPADVWMNDPGAKLQLLIPDELQYDFAMNIFTFDPGHGLPYVETHVMEHGLLVLQGKGLYYLDGEWMEVEKDDFIWMGPYCPQSYYATGPTVTKYIYYKNVNREIQL
jgi:(S)-ureidoglycine aminohydrolase